MNELDTRLDFERPILTVDVVLFALIDSRLHVLLANRDREPYKGIPALIGGYIHVNEDADTYAAARRVCKAKLKMNVTHLEQLAVFSGLKRDPRGWSATTAYIAMIKNVRRFNRDEFYPVDSLPTEIAFDHRIIVKWAVDRLRNKTSYSSLPLFLMPDEFTLYELQNLYEKLMGHAIDDRTFRRKIMDNDIIEETGSLSDPTITKVRPAKLFRRKPKLTTVRYFVDAI